MSQIHFHKYAGGKFSLSHLRVKQCENARFFCFKNMQVCSLDSVFQPYSVCIHSACCNHSVNVHTAHQQETITVIPKSVKTTDNFKTSQSHSQITLGGRKQLWMLSTKIFISGTSRALQCFLTDPYYFHVCQRFKV